MRPLLILACVLASGCAFDASGFQRGASEDADVFDPPPPDASPVPVPDAGGERDDAPDAEPPSPQADCEDLCEDGTCVDGVCTINCRGRECGRRVVCPEDVPCEVTCEGRTCGEIDCREATACTVNCVGDRSCHGPIRCGDGPCEVFCSGDETCSGEVDCEDSCACDVACTGEDSCETGTSCPEGCELGDDGPGCTSDALDCDMCAP